MGRDAGQVSAVSDLLPAFSARIREGKLVKAPAPQESVVDGKFTEFIQLQAKPVLRQMLKQRVFQTRDEDIASLLAAVDSYAEEASNSTGRYDLDNLNSLKEQ
jgi:hypothetical protein